MAASRAASGFVRALSKRRSTPGASFSTQASKPASPVPMAVAGVAVLSAGFVGAFRFVTGPMSVDTGDHPQVVSSQEELNELRSKLFNEGVRDACTGGLVWGASGAAIIYGLRNLEPKMLGSNNLIKAGHPRMWYLITSVAAFGFYMRGETKLLNATRKYTLSGSAH
mmetsp:Transcript_12851/g.20392  ORF Transcript_12851/g.20392 Transcript_12851/m.20392 type:complete len:167 (+) Transcript_12851:70-570(+)